MSNTVNRLTSLFAAAALGVGAGVGIGVSIQGEPAKPETPVVKNETPVVQKVTVSEESLKLWDTIKQRDSVDYTPGNRPAPPAEKAQNVVALQLESYDPVYQSLILQGPPGEVFIRHGASATEIINQTADRVSGKDVAPLYIETREPAVRWLGKGDHEFTRSLFDNADVVSLSMGAMKGGPQEFQMSEGNLSLASQIQSADKFWEDTKAIMVAAAGNNGRATIGLERRDATLQARADTLLIVGEAHRDDKSGEDFIFQASSQAGVSLVAENPYMNGFSYPFIRDEKNLREFLDKVYAGPLPGTPMTVQQAFEDGLKSWRGSFNPLQAGNPDFKNADFESKKFLEQPWAKQVADPEQARKAFIDALVSSLPGRADQFDEMAGTKHDAEGNFSNMSGTSFTGPHVAGMIAGGRESHPELSPRDLVAAALLAANPEAVMKAQKFEHPTGFAMIFGSHAGPRMIDIEFPNNGRNLPFDSYRGGFGLLTEENYKATLADMSAMLAKNPALATVEKKAESALVAFAEVKPEKDQKTIDYKIAVTDDIVALRTNLALHFVGGPARAPGEITLINPAGGEVHISPSKLESSDPFDFSLATTDGHFGNYTKGEWIVRVPVSAPLESARLTVQGMQKGGLADVLLKEKVDGTTPVTKHAATVESEKAAQSETPDADEIMDGFDEEDGGLIIQLPDIILPEPKIEPPKIDLPKKAEETAPTLETPDVPPLERNVAPIPVPAPVPVPAPQP